MSEQAQEQGEAQAEAPTVEFFGEKFAVPTRINRRLVYKFVTLASKGVTTTDAEGAEALTRLLDQCVVPADLARFDDVCDRERPDDEELLSFIKEMLAAWSGRPISRPSDSSDGPSSTEASSEGDLSSQVIVRQVKAGRPDLALMVMDAQKARVSA